MAIKKNINLIKILLALALFSNSLFGAEDKATIKGTVREAQTAEALYGANLMIVGTGLGSSTDFDGNYVIHNVPMGTHILQVSYIGYKEQLITVDVTSGKTILIDIKMESEIIEGETVVITAQREGQAAAINQQITANSIKNIVAGDKIEELPEANAAEAVGRLPGISIERVGGEGSKVTIRGLAPKYNKIQIDGVTMAATDSDDRSTDLSMISPYMLGGIEVSKSAMADQEADQLGGIVNFITKGAPYGKPSYKIVLEGGYNGLREEAGDFRIAAQTSRRVFDEMLGISLNLDIEKRNRSSNSLSAGYEYLQKDSIASVNSLSVLDITRKLNRYGGTLRLDFKTESTVISLNNMLSMIERTNVSRSENSSVRGGSSRTQNLSYSESTTAILMNQLKLEQNFGDLKIDAGISYSYSKDNEPEILSYGGIEPTPLKTEVAKNASPDLIPSYMKNDLKQIMLGPMTDSDSFTKEDELGAQLNAQWGFNVTDLINLDFKIGGMFKHKNRKYDYNTIYLNIFSDPSNTVNNAILAKWPWMQEYYVSGKFPYQGFIDYGYDPGDFMAGEFSIERIPNMDMGIDLIHYLENELGIDWQGATVPTKFTPNFHTSKRYDYSGTEDYSAAYIMPTLTFGDWLTFIPGLRYEKNKTSYNGVRGNAMLQVTESMGFVYYDTTVTRTDEFLLPMLHLKFKPLDWFDVRVSYTQTLSRPSYTEIIPTWYIYMTGIDFRNPNLKPAKSENIDLYFSVYDNKVGLFTVGLFAKKIHDLIFDLSKIVISDTMAVDEYGLAEEYTGVKPTKFVGKSINSLVNNQSTVDVKGIEVEWQSNLWYLPGFLNNIVFTINYTYTFSEAKYPRTVPIKKTIQTPVGPTAVTVGNADASFYAPLISQPDHILNITLGYDYEGFSIRGSMQYKSEIFAQNDWRPELRGYTKAFTIFDLSLSQKLPVEGLIVFGNLNNITRTIESDYNAGTGYFSSKQYYGLSAALGIKYQF